MSMMWMSDSNIHDQRYSSGHLGHRKLLVFMDVVESELFDKSGS